MGSKGSARYQGKVRAAGKHLFDRPRKERVEYAKRETKIQLYERIGS
jgi:hypothetical protein